MTNEIAIYQVGYAFFGVGQTLEAAIKDAKEWTAAPLSAETISDDDTIHGNMVWVHVTPALAAAIRDDGQCRHEELPSGIYGTPAEAEAAANDDTTPKPRPGPTSSRW